MSVSAIPLRVEAGSSLYLTAYLLSVHGAAAAALWHLELGAAASILCFAAVAASVAHGICVHGWRCARGSIVSAEQAADGDWVLRTRGGATLSGRLLPSTFCAVFLVVVNFRTGRVGLRSLVLAPDAARAEELRRLRVYLRRRGTERPHP